MLKSLFNIVAELIAGNFIKKRLQHRRFPVNIEKFFYRTHVYYTFPKFYAMIDIRNVRVIFYIL